MLSSICLRAQEDPQVKTPDYVPPTTEELTKAYPLLNAAALGDLPRLRALLAKGEDPNQVQDGGTALRWAVMERQSEAVRILLKAGADIHEGSKGSGRTALQFAGSNPAMLKLLLASGASLEKDDAGTETMLHEAARDMRSPESIAILVQAGANVNVLDQSNWTPLMYAVKAGKLENVRLLIEMGSKVNQQDNEGLTAIDLVEKVQAFGSFNSSTNDYTRASYADTQKLRDELRQMLREAGAVGSHDPGSSPEVVKAESGDDFRTRKYPLHNAAVHEDLGRLEALLAGGRDPNERDQDGNTPLHWAVRQKKIAAAMASALLKAGAIVDAEDGSNETALNRGWQQKEVLEILLAAKANLEHPNSEGETPLLEAARASAKPEVERLIAAGADANAKNGIKWTALMYAAAVSDVDTIKVLLRAHADVALKNDKGLTALDMAPVSAPPGPIPAGVPLEVLYMDAKRYQQVADTQRLLREAGAVPTTGVVSEHSQRSMTEGTVTQARVAEDFPDAPPFLLAIALGDIDRVKTMLKEGADLKMTTPMGLSIWSAALRQPRSPELIRILVAAGADPNKPINNMGLPLGLAFSLGDIESIKALIAAGANPRWKGPSGITLLELLEQSQPIPPATPPQLVEAIRAGEAKREDMRKILRSPAVDSIK